jgi:hypothetical protein
MRVDGRPRLLSVIQDEDVWVGRRVPAKRLYATKLGRRVLIRDVK